MASEASKTDSVVSSTGTTTETITRTVVCKLETSRRKNERLRGVIQEWQEIAETVADYHASFPPYEWGRTKQNPSFYRIVGREFPEREIYARSALEAVHKVGVAFDSWDSNGRHGDRPQFGDGGYARFGSDGIEVIENDKGWGLRVKLYPGEDPEWWHIDAGAYQREYLSSITGGDSDAGSAELHLHDNGDLYAHLTMNRDVEVYDAGEVSVSVGVDLGERTIYAAAAVDSDTIEQVEVEPGREFRHHREQLKQKRYRLMERGDLRGVKKCRNEHRRYTNHKTHVASKEIVGVAESHSPSAIILERLTGYRESEDDAIHDWPFAELQEKITYKATEAGIPVEFVDPGGTSYICSKCGSETAGNRNGVTFSCQRCGYEVHSDVNAAINIGKKGLGS